MCLQGYHLVLRITTTSSHFLNTSLQREWPLHVSKINYLPYGHSYKNYGASFELEYIFYTRQTYFHKITQVVKIHLVGHNITIFVSSVKGQFIFCLEPFVKVTSHLNRRGKRNVSPDLQNILHKSIFQCWHCHDAPTNLLAISNYHAIANNYTM